MPSFDIIKESDYQKTFRNESIKGQFDLSIQKIQERFSGVIDIENKKWNVGVIVGNSGTGKTSIAKQIFKDFYFEKFEFDNSKSILDCMPQDKTTEQITSVFNSVGFSTVWSWLKPYEVLSQGEQMRVNLAYVILQNQDFVVFDEFTSVVDRTIAKTMSSVISKYIKKNDKRFIAVTCHYDILEWLEPDWIYDTTKQEFFFAQTSTNVQQYNYKFSNVIQDYGVFLKNITI